jgi:TRAP transporter 4TM/12TM fusion protein
MNVTGAFAAAKLVLAAASVGFHVFIVFSGLIPALILRPLHVALAMPFVFVFGPARGRLATLVGYALCAVGVAGCLFIVAFRRALVDQYGTVEGWFQHALAIALILIVLEMARRAVKPVMPTIALIVLLYGLLGEHIPGEWGHAGLPLDSFLGTLVLSEGGLWGSLTAVSAELVAPFLVLGAFVAAGEAGTGFMALAQKIAGRFRAGAAKVEVVASALYGTISGSASANVASTGTFTIPIMIRQGYPPPFAAAVEAVASTGGQIMPPVMGAGVFLMATLVQIPYSELMVIATPPAVLFFLATWFGVHQVAVGLGLRAMSPDAIPTWRTVLRTFPFFMGPLGTLIAIIAFTGYTATFAGVCATVLAAALLLFDAEMRVSLRRFAARAADAIGSAAEQIGSIAAIIVCAGIITGVFHMTGFGVKLTSLIVGFSGGKLWVALLLTAAACIVLGMELPTTAAYVICVAVAGPALVQLGLPPLQAHLFVFWYALLCTITPPVCGNVFIAASIADTPWLPVAWRAMRLGAGLFVVPLGFVANPSLLAILSDPLLTLLATVKVAAALWLLSYGLLGTHLGAVLRLAAAIAAGVVLFAYGI